MSIYSGAIRTTHAPARSLSSGHLLSPLDGGFDSAFKETLPGGCACAECCAVAATNARPLVELAPDLVPASTATTSTINSGGSVEVSIDTLGDHDWYRVTLIAGQTYTIHTSAITGQNPDTFLNLRSSAGAILLSDDDGGDSTYSVISYTPATTGTFFIDAGTFNNESIGSYRLSVSTYPLTSIDVLGSAATSATLGVGNGINGTIDVVGDRDWYSITLVAGETYIFRTGNTSPLSGTGAPVGAVDTLLSLRNAAGTQVGFSDDAGQYGYSAIRYTATTSGTYYLDVGAYSGQGATGAATGTYNLTAFSTPALTVYTNDQIALQLTNGYWNGTSHNFNVAPGGTLTYNLGTISAAAANLAREAFNLWGDVTGIIFSEVTTGGAITFADTETGAYATAAYTASGITTSATVNIGTAWLTTYGTGLNSYSFQTFIHEIGHTLGLGHGGNYNGNASYASDALYSNDSWATTIMSYFDQQENSYTAALGFTRQFAVTPLVADGVALAALYGTNTLTRTGNTTYGFNNTSGRAVYDATANPNVGYAVFDNGGIDTLDYSGFTQNQRINLNAEGFSDIGGRVGNISIARGAVIENAIGGTGNDTLYGNAANNTLTGGAGNDILFGYDGDDVLDGGAGANVIVGAAGNDIITVTASGNEIYGGIGNDIFNVASRSDTIVEYVGEGLDEVRTALAIYDLSSAPNVEWLRFTDDTVHAGVGNASDNVILGGAGADTLVGAAGNDQISGGNGAANTLLGGTGDDLFIVTTAGETIIEYTGEGTDTVHSFLTVFYLPTNVENLIYMGGGSTIAFAGIGSAASNQMTAGFGADFLSGLEGDDILIGGSGADLLIGGTGADHFRYNGGETGYDRIIDFEAGIDKIALSGAGFTRTATIDFVSSGAPVATSANSTFLYDVNTGIVSYDADGNGGGAAVQLAQLNTGLNLTASDFVFV
jgi:serralysin